MGESGQKNSFPPGGPTRAPSAPAPQRGWAAPVGARRPGHQPSRATCWRAPARAGQAAAGAPKPPPPPAPACHCRQSWRGPSAGISLPVAWGQSLCSPLGRCVNGNTPSPPAVFGHRRFCQPRRLCKTRPSGCLYESERDALGATSCQTPAAGAGGGDQSGGEESEAPTLPCKADIFHAAKRGWERWPAWRWKEGLILHPLSLLSVHLGPF